MPDGVVGAGGGGCVHGGQGAVGFPLGPLWRPVVSSQLSAVSRGGAAASEPWAQALPARRVEGRSSSARSLGPQIDGIDADFSTAQGRVRPRQHLRESASICGQQLLASQPGSACKATRPVASQSRVCSCQRTCPDCRSTTAPCGSPQARARSRILRPESGAVCAHVSGSQCARVAARKKAVRRRTDRRSQAPIAELPPIRTTVEAS